MNTVRLLHLNVKMACPFCIPCQPRLPSNSIIYDHCQLVHAYSVPCNLTDRCGGPGGIAQLIAVLITPLS